MLFSTGKHCFIPSLGNWQLLNPSNDKSARLRSKISCRQRGHECYGHFAVLVAKGATGGERVKTCITEKRNRKAVSEKDKKGKEIKRILYHTHQNISLRLMGFLTINRKGLWES